MHKCITFAPCKYVSECEGPSVRLLKTYKIKKCTGTLLNKNR